MFLTLQSIWMTATLTGGFERFDVLADAALELATARCGQPVRAQDRRAIVAALTSLPAHAEVADALGSAAPASGLPRSRTGRHEASPHN